MQHTLVSCQVDATSSRRVAPNSTPVSERQSARKGWTPNPCETTTHTESRRTGRRAWLKALDIAAEKGLVPGFNATTRAIVDVLTTRMGFDSGHARYVLDDVMERTGLKRTAVTDHIKLLRRTGWLAWVEHGSLRNALRSLGRPGYARTATVYAATIPPAYDRLMGHLVIGSGYTARVRAVRPAPPVHNPVDSLTSTSVENSGTESSRTPSLWVDKEVGQVQVVEGKDASTANAAATKSRRKRKLTVTGYRITGPRIEEARRHAVTIRPLVNWIQGSSHDELSWVFLDLVARGWSHSRIVLWLGKLGQDIGAARRRPYAPHRVIAAALLRKDREEATQAVPAALEADEYRQRPAAPNAAFGSAQEAVRRRHGGGEEYPTVDAVAEDSWDYAILAEAAKEDPAIVLSFAQIQGRAAAERVFGDLGIRILRAADEEARTGIRILVRA